MKGGWRQAGFAAPARAAPYTAAEAQPPEEGKLLGFGSRTLCPQVLPGSFGDQIHPQPPGERDAGKTHVSYSKACLNLIHQKCGSGPFGVGCKKRCYVCKLSHKHTLSRKEKKKRGKRGQEGNYVSWLPTRMAPSSFGLMRKGSW